jgi:hypothetical protein
MPLLNQLGELAVERVGYQLSVIPTLPNFNESFTFENWLTTLSENQPYLSESANAHNRYVFHLLVAGIIEILGECEDAALLSESPKWLRQLILLWHFRQATVLTFNFDRIVEAVLSNIGIVHDAPWQARSVSEDDILLFQPPDAFHDLDPMDQWSPTFRYLKLHGSLNWYIATNDPSGSSLVRHPVLIQDGLPRSLDRNDWSRYLPGREVFAVPPTLSKTLNIQNLLMHDLWQASFHALTSATHLAIVGYSMSAADVTVFEMINDATRHGPIDIEVVNPAGNSIAARLRDIGLDPVVEISEENCVEHFVASYLDRAERSFLQEMRRGGPNHGPDYPVLISTKTSESGSLYARVIEIHKDTATGNVVIDAVPRGLNLTNAASNDAFGVVTPRGMTLELIDALDGANRASIKIAGIPHRPVNTDRAWNPVQGGQLALLINAIED